MRGGVVVLLVGIVLPRREDFIECLDERAEQLAQFRLLLNPAFLQTLRQIRHARLHATGYSGQGFSVQAMLVRAEEI